MFSSNSLSTLGLSDLCKTGLNAFNLGRKTQLFSVAFEADCRAPELPVLLPSEHPYCSSLLSFAE